jgi:hypothetical protein
MAEKHFYLCFDSLNAASPWLCINPQKMGWYAFRFMPPFFSTSIAHYPLSLSSIELPQVAHPMA